MSHRSYDGFEWPKEVGAIVSPREWRPEPSCGWGLHGWPWGTGLGDGKEPVFADAIWQVVSALPADIVLIDGGSKVKCREVRIEYIGSWWGALAFVEVGKTAWIHHASSGAASATGWSGAASATGWSGAASATGGSGAASATGGRGAASATGWSGAAVTCGEYSTVECGKDGLAASTANEVTWIVRPDAIFVHRWPGGFKAFTPEDLGAVDGERITFNRGEIISRVKPTEGETV